MRFSLPMSLSLRLFAALALLIGSSPALAVGGTLNSYASVSNISGTTLTVSTTTGFAAGDTVIVIQMQGATVDRTNAASHGTVSAVNSAGRFEYATIASTGASTITLSSTLATSFQASGAVQVVRVASYTNVVIDSTTIAPPWDGSVGGVVAIDATGSLTLTSSINVSGRGFRGGSAPATGTFSCGSSSTAYTGTATAGAGNKGEGATVNNSSHAAYRGRQSSGGGGGNPMDAGGGGGANAGTGGIGGREESPCNGATGGLGGASLSYTGNDRLFMGGGGGSGSATGQSAFAAGGRGGGIVLLRVNSLIGNGGQVTADGSGGTGEIANGAGGGGAGGAIAIRAASGSGSVTVRAVGGAGGGIADSGTAHGPGGGGGGGFIGYAGSLSGVSFSSTIGGGGAGSTTEGLNLGEINWGATGGSSGSLSFAFSLPAIAPQVPQLSVTKASALFATGSNGVFYIPGNFIEYTVTVSNTGTGAADGGSMALDDTLPTNVTFFNGDHDGSGNPLLVSGGGGLTCCSAANVSFRNAAGVPLSPQPGYGATGIDASIQRIVITPTGALAAGGTLTIRFRVQIK